MLTKIFLTPFIPLIKPVLFVLVLLSIMAFFAIKFRKDTQKLFGERAAELNLEDHTIYSLFGSGIPEFQGEYKSHRLKLINFVRGYKQHSKVFTRIDFYLNYPKDLVLHIKPEMGRNISEIPILGDYFKEFRKTLKKTMKVKDIRIKDQRFDNDFVINGAPFEQIKKVLNKDIRKTILKFNNRNAGVLRTKEESREFEIVVKKKKIIFQYAGPLLEKETMFKLFEFLSEFATEIESLD